MSEARVQEEWMFEEGIHERRLEAVPLAGSLAVHDEVHHAHGEAISDALLVASKQHDQKARARVPLDARTLDISHYNDFINYSENFRLLNSAQEKVLGKIVQNGLSAADEVKNARDNNVQPHATLLRAVANGEKAQEQFFNANLRLVVSVAGGYARNPLARGVLRMDLIQYGMFGLKRAIEKFDPTRGFKFSTYAHDWISQAIDRGIKDNEHAIRLPINRHELATKIETRTNKGMSEGKIQKELELSDDDMFLVKHTQLLRQGHKSLDEPVKSRTHRDEASDSSLGDYVADVRVDEQFEATYDRNEQKDKVTSILKVLEPRLTPTELKIMVKLVYGERLTDSEKRQKKKLDGLFSHPVVRDDMIGFLDENSEDWRDEAACIGSGDLYTRPHVNAVDKAEIARVCGGCVVRKECAKFFKESRPEKGRWIDGRSYNTETYSQKGKKKLKPAAKTRVGG